MLLHKLSKLFNRAYVSYLTIPVLLLLSACGGGEVVDARVETANQNTVPAISIDTPTSGSEFGESNSVTFSATATDREDGNIESNISWFSNIDGNIGSGSNIMVNLSVGIHTITASVIDSGSLSNETSINISLVNVSQPSVELVDIDTEDNITMEYAPTGSSVGITINASNFSDTITYRLTDDAEGRFSINPDTGVVSTANGSLIEASNTANHEIIVTAENAEGFSINGTFIISVLDDGCPVEPNMQSSSTYTVSWDKIVDGDLTGFKLYYGNQGALTKENALGSIDISGNVESAIFNPGDFNFTTCQSTFLAIASTGFRDESYLSNQMALIIE